MTLDEILNQLAQKARLSAYSPGYTKLQEKPVDTDQAKAQILQLVREAKPNKRPASYYSDKLDLYVRQSASNGYNNGVDEYEKNLLQLLGETDGSV